MTDVLESIVQKTRERLAEQKRRVSQDELERSLSGRSKPRGFAKALRQFGGMSVIAELKQASPSAGIIREERDLPGRVQAYSRGGAAALSILTEEYYFHGSSEILEIARKETEIPILRKDFIIDPYQLTESALIGADAVLLITTLLDLSQLRELLAHARSLGLDALVETHQVRDVEKALKSEADMIGVNHRDLRTLQMNMSLSKTLMPMIPKDKTRVVESGIKQPSDLAIYRELGAHAVLIGETLMRAADAQAAVRTFVEAGFAGKGA